MNIRVTIDQSFALMERLSSDDLYALAAHVAVPDAGWSQRIVQQLVRAELMVRERTR